MKDYLITQETEKFIHIPVTALTGEDLNSIIIRYMKHSVEGICDNFGYIEKGSLKLLSKRMGKIRTVDGESV